MTMRDVVHPRATLLFLVSILAAGPSTRIAAASPAPVERARYLMGTICTAEAWSEDTARAARSLDAAFAEIARLENVMSSWKKDSELSRLNAVGGSAWFPCSPDLFAVIDTSLKLAKITRGKFDPTIEPLNVVWDTRGKGRLPKPEQLQRAMSLLGWRRVNLDVSQRRVMFPFGDMGIDLGGIGKGFALDRAARALTRSGVERALLNFGGEVLAIGPGWPVKVAHPAARLTPAVEIEVSDAAVSTSSQSERGVTVKGKRYGHIFDPETGRPLETEASVTVVGPTGTRADAFSTALLVMGREDAAAFAAAHPELGVLWLEPAGNAVRAWKWNLPSARAAEGVTLDWMNE